MPKEPERKHLVWQETKSNAQPFQIAVNISMTKEEADAMAVFLTAMRPEGFFVVSVSQPKFVIVN